MPDASRKPVVAFIFTSLLWKEGAGLWARSRALCRYLGRHLTLHLVHVGRVRAPEAELRVATGCQALLELGGLDSDDPRLASTLREFLDLHQVETVIIEKTELSLLVPVVPKQLRKLVDTHDIVSDREARLKAFGLPSRAVSVAQEIDILRQFDGVIAIQAEDQRKLSAWLGNERVLLAPHPVESVPLPARERVHTLGLLASAWIANVEGLNWFIDRVWPRVHHDALELKVFGAVGRFVKATRGVSIAGFAQNLKGAYQELDVVINPVRAGAGLKIKSVEALGFARPLVTTREGARGLEHLDGTGLLIGDDEESFARHLASVIENPHLRARLSRGATQFVEGSLTAPRCFNPLLRFLKTQSPAIVGAGSQGS